MSACPVAPVAGRVEFGVVCRRLRCLKVLWLARIAERHPSRGPCAQWWLSWGRGERRLIGCRARGCDLMAVWSAARRVSGVEELR